jgi:endonuclease-8
MPEGPSLVIVKEAIRKFNRKKIREVAGNAKIDKESFTGQKLVNIQTWGKHLLLGLDKSTIRVHFLLFGSYSIDEQTRPDKSLRLELDFSNGKLFFYTCSILLLPADVNELYDWEADVLSDKWKPAKARRKLKDIPQTMVCDALLNQDIFAGVGNIIKNEVLYRIKLHPETLVENIPAAKLSALIKEARQYSFDFLKWKKEFVLKKHWLAYNKKICLRCDLPFKKKYCGKTKRKTFFCTNCQSLYIKQL